MYKKILLCYDGTAEGRRALRQGAEVAVAMQSHAYLLAICRNLVATALPEGITPQLITTQEDSAKAILAEGVRLLGERHVQAEGSLVYGEPLVHIPQVAERIGADLVVVGFRYRSALARWWTQSEQGTLLDRLSCSLLVAIATPPSQLPSATER
jgi:nucleotide-binding universal stress UspA family protein